MKKKPLSTSKSSDQDVSILENQALSKLNAGQYKEAIDLYKSLLKRANNADWRQALAQCYLQRALTFASKGMVKEALVLWENYAQNAEPPHQARDQYISWLLQTNDMAKAKTCLGQLTAQQLDELYPDLAGLLGLLIITGKISCQDMLPKDSVFMRHLGLVQEALSAYQHNKLEEIERALKMLPFRSAFRDFRPVMKAVLMVPESVEQAQSLLAKIPLDSPYQQMGALLLAITHDGAALVNDLFQFTPPQIKIIEETKNLNKKQIELLDVLTKQKDRLSDKVKFNLAIQYQTLFGVDLAKHYCLAALSTYPAGQRDFIRHYGAINDFEAWRLKALVCERNGDFYGAEYYWKQGITVLNTQGAEGAFKIALILRHIAAHQESPEEVITWLIDSLSADPDDRETYVKILQYYERQEQETDTYKEWLDKSILKFPNDVELLGMAIKASTRNKAFKKATQYAQALLKMDPVNTFAKQVLFTSHLAHARKLIKSKKFHLVEKEIQQAEKITISKRYQTQAQLMRGLFVFIAEDKNRGEQLITEAMQKINDGIFNAHFCVIMEALLLNSPIAPLLKILPPLPKDYLLPQKEMVQFAQLIQQYADDESANQILVHKALEKVKAIIKLSLKQDYSEETLLTFCQSLDRILHFELLRACVKIAQPLWDKPIWMYYRVYAEANGKPAKCSNINRYRLKDSLQKAQEQNDQRAAGLIDKFLKQIYESRKPPGFNFFDSLFGGSDDDEDPIDQLFGHLPDDLFEQLDQKTTELTKKTPPERMLKILAANYLSNNVNRMYDLLKDDPEALYAFLMLKAADDLGIDIGVTAEMIVECFQGQKAASKPTSFPFF
jgi:tetratricopeptide (TPR) repeat protein